MFVTLLSLLLPMAQAQTGQVRYYPRVGQESRMVGGLFQGSNDNSTWTTLYTVTAKPADAYTTATLTTDPQTFRYLRYLAPHAASGNVAEIEFYSHGIKLTGTGFGTPGSYNNDGFTFQNALDGNTSTFFNAPSPGNDDFVGIDRGAPTLSSLTFSPTSGFGGSTNPTGTVTLTSAATAATTVTLSSPSASLVVPASVTVSAGSTSATFTATSHTVTTAATITVTASSGGVSKTGMFTVNPTYISALAFNPTIVLGGSANSTGTVTLAGAVGSAQTITLTSSNTAALSVPSSLSIPYGTTSGTFTATSHSVAAATTVTVTASYNGGSKMATVTVTVVPILTSITVLPASATLNTGGTQQFTATAYDQNGVALSPQPTLTWSVVSGGVGTVSASGLYSAGTTAGSATVKATSGTVSGTAAVTVNAAAAVPLYLSNLTLNSTAVIGGNATTGTVTLSSPAPAGGVTVALRSNSSAATVPATCPVSAGATQATFGITTGTVSASTDVTLAGSYNGWTQGSELSVLPSSPPSNPPPGVPVIHVAAGNGCAIISWNRLAAGTVSGYNIYRTSGGTRTLLTAMPFASNYYPDAGLTNDTATYSYQVAAVDTQGREQALSGAVSAAPSSAAVTLNWINPPSAVTDWLDVDASLSSGGQVFGSLFFIDGVEAGGDGSTYANVNGVQTYTAGIGYDSTKLSNGPHTVQLLGFADFNRTVAAVTPPITVQVSNVISSFHIDNSGFDPIQGELCYLSATAPAGSTWTVQATSQDGSAILRTWQGASSLVKLAWDGKDASGNVVPLTDYTLQLTVQPPGGSPKAAVPFSAQPTPSAIPEAAPNAAGTSKKTRPTSPTHGQPAALALVSVGASYYLGSKNVPVETPAQDIMLSNVVTNAYTALFGTGNFKIIRSDTFDPFVEVKKGVTYLDQLEGWLGTAQVFYLFGHGAGLQGGPGPSQTPRSTVFGDYAHTMGVHMEFFPSVIFSPAPLDIIVPTYVKSRPYVFAWLDSCNSAGGNSTTGEIGTEDDVWAMAFNATTFIGSNGFDIVNNGSATGPTGVSPWYTWRQNFWNQLAMGQTVYQGYLNCWNPPGAVDQNTYYCYYTLQSMNYTCTPGDGYSSSTPRVVLYGDTVDTTLVPQ